MKRTKDVRGMSSVGKDELRQCMRQAIFQQQQADSPHSSALAPPLTLLLALFLSFLIHYPHHRFSLPPCLACPSSLFRPSEVLNGGFLITLKFVQY